MTLIETLLKDRTNKSLTIKHETYYIFLLCGVTTHESHATSNKTGNTISPVLCFLGSVSRTVYDLFYFIAKLLLGNPVVDVTHFKMEFSTNICLGFLGTYP